jgi:hypothetical protein
MPCPVANLVKELRVTPNLIGEYTNRCAELCGGAHAYMNSPVRVVSQADFDAWVEEQTGAADLSPAERGERVSRKRQRLPGLPLATDGTRLAGPTWLNLYGAEAVGFGLLYRHPRRAGPAVWSNRPGSLAAWSARWPLWSALAPSPTGGAGPKAKKRPSRKSVEEPRLAALPGRQLRP